MKNKQQIEKSARIQEYMLAPNHCRNCKTVLPYPQRKNVFCSSSCAATFNNLKRGHRSLSSKIKVSMSLKARHRLLHPPHTKIRFCNCCICEKTFIWNSYSKGSIRFCSMHCQKTFLSKFASERLKKLKDRSCYGRGKKSYLEKSFEEWLTAHDINFETEIRFSNLEENKNYFVDFYFPNLKLVIELDGTQHRKTVEQDQLRDAYLKQYYGLNVIRVTYTEYQRKSKLDLICQLLGIQK